jgi:dipeptidyl aminopeptidase/acylaminoacyl peptidase
MRLRALLPCSLLVLASCGDAFTDPATPQNVRLTVVAASSPLVQCRSDIPVTVTVTNSLGRPVPYFHLNFNVLEGEGRIFGGAALTNLAGVARDIWTVGDRANVRNTMAVRSVDQWTGIGTTYFSQTVTTLSKIAFVSGDVGYNTTIHAMNADGSNPALLTTTSPSFDTHPSWSPDGSKLAVANGEIVVMNADGSGRTNLTNHRGDSDSPSWSHDGRQIAFITSNGDGNAGVFVVNVDGSALTRLTYPEREATIDATPAWSPDDSRIAFMRNGFIYVMNADGSAVARVTDHALGIISDMQPAWSPDGRKIAFMSNRADLRDADIYVVNANGSGLTRLTSAPYPESEPFWSPDGGQIAFTSSRDGNRDIYFMNANGSGVTRLTTDPAPDFQPAWSGCVRP